MTRFQDIPQFTRPCFYKINVGWAYLEKHLEDWLYPTAGAALDLDPDFQRAHVWTAAQQTKYVEFMLRGGHSAKELLFNCTGWNDDYRGPFVIVDGKQRLEAVRKFLRNELPIFGENRYQDYTDKLRLSHTDFIMEVNNLETREQVLTWYLETNTGGTPHTEAEIKRVKKLLSAEKSK